MPSKKAYKAAKIINGLLVDFVVIFTHFRKLDLNSRVFSSENTILNAIALN
jgi:hypothetical protein